MALSVAWYGTPTLPVGSDLVVIEIPAADGTTLLEAPEAGPVPTVLVAVTVKVYVTPLVSPVTVIGDAALETFTVPGIDVTV